ncbi:cubilin-like, partial [Agrilus planipennis]|uniref:Cubilin-like n=1 Tax=Agrilus planipennis TaxID=224129 RepID=A0A7F5RIV9_AGRPL
MTKFSNERGSNARKTVINRRISLLNGKVRRLIRLLNIDECASNPCRNGANCKDIYNGVLCFCTDGWEGRRYPRIVEKDGVICLEKDNVDHSTIIYTILITLVLHLAILDLRGSPLIPRETSIYKRTVFEFQLLCWGLYCENDINECQRFTHTDLGCQNGATCVNTPGSYECKCLNGWHGIHCTERSTDCNSGSSAELCGHGTCINENSAEGYKCICEQGWKSDKTNPACIVDVDECSLDKPSCSINPLVACINTPGSYICGHCPAGYTGNGFYCADIDECAIFNGGCSVSPTVQCINTQGSRICGPCPPGYVGDGFSCSYRGICHVNNGGCHYLAQCRDNPRISSTFVECFCPEGFVGSGIGPNGCTKRTGGDPCSSSPCLYGTCVSRDENTYECHCTSQFEGRNCDKRKNPCSPNPCLNGASCIQVFNISFVCNCTASFTGPLCNQEKQACGGRLTHEFGTLEYPPPGASLSNQRSNCAWLIETKQNLTLNIVFDKFNVYKSVDCQTDWLQIHDGANTAAHSLGRFCGDTLPANGRITTSHNSVFMWLKSDHSNSNFRITWNSSVPACTDYITFTSHGVLQSPGSPGNYPLNRECEWHLSAPPGKRIEFHFFKLDIGHETNCTGDYVEFLDSSTSLKRRLAKYCETSQPEPLTSFGSDVEVRFHSDEVGSHSGFQISYTAIESLPGCGGVFTSNKGEIQSPMIDGRYPSDIICEYVIKSDSGSRIKLTFLKFELEEATDCDYDYLELHEGANSLAPLIGKYCGKELPASYTSIENVLCIIFKSDFSLQEGGFIIKYETVCGGIFEEQSGTISSPGYPSNYPEDRICVYEIIQPAGKIIELVFQDVDLENSLHVCSFDYIEVRDGHNENSTLLGTLCEKPSSFLSTYNYLFIKFVSDISITGRGFIANYSTVDIECGGLLTKDRGSITSTNNYFNNMNCSWLLIAPAGKIIKLTWDTFSLEDCPYDHVIVYDISNTFGKREIGTYCGFRIPPIIMSSENMLEIQFITDATKTTGQFSLNYVFLEDKNVCGGSFFTTSGIIKSPNFPNEYPSRNTDCDWIIHVGAGQQIMLNVTDFALENNECRYDWLEIRNTDCDWIIHVGAGQQIMLNVTDFALENNECQYDWLEIRLDFHLEILSGLVDEMFESQESCGGALSSPDGVIISPQYPESYSSNLECYWRISTNVGSFLRITITDIELEQSDCNSDYIQIYDGLQNSKLLGVFCTMKNVVPIHSTSNHVGIKFVSDGAIEGRGFHLQYSTDCRNTVTGFNGAIESPNFPNNFPHEMNCTWKIEVLRGNKINLTISRLSLLREFQLDSKNCSINYLEIWSINKNSERNMIERYCSDLNYETQLTVNSDKVEIHFATDSSFIGDGFRLEWQQFGCGGILKRPSGSFTSPNYPQFYPPGVTCKWIIEVNYGNSVELLFKEIDTEDRFKFGNDYIEVINGPESDYPVLTTLSGRHSKPVVVTSTGNFMTVLFISGDLSMNGNGFIASYSSIPSKCGGKFTAFFGSFHSPNYPYNYQLQESCEYYIEIEDSHTIELLFVDFDIASDPSCNQSYIKIYDGPTQAYPTLKKLCGNQKFNGTIKSSYNHMLVEFVANYSYTAKGFIADYITACGARITTEDSGIIGKRTSLQYGGNSYCIWTISAANPSQHIYLTFTHIFPDNSFSDDNSTVIATVHNGDSDTDPILLKLTPLNGQQEVYTTTSTGDSLHIITRNDIEFEASYSILETSCGGMFSHMNGYFASPYFPKSYPVNMECEWIIQTSPGWSVSLSFDHFDILDSEECDVDFLEIREANSTGKVLQILCGDTIPATVSSRMNLWVLFKSSESNLTGTGFKVHFSLSPASELSGSFGQIMSPFYPLYTAHDISTHWKITVPFGHCISLDLKNIYNRLCVEFKLLAKVLWVFDGHDNNARLLYSGCSVSDKPIRSTSNVLYIKWESIYDSRFSLAWNDMGKCTNTMNTNIARKSSKCGEEIAIDMSLVSNYKLTSPGYPHGYGSNLECTWTFYTMVPENHLAINFNDINLDNNIDKCFFDKIEIYTENELNGWKIQDTVCLPNATNAVFNYGSSVRIIFKSNRYGNGSGFSANVLQECGGSITESNGLININDTYLKMYQSNSTSRLICQWNITVKTGRILNVTLLELNLQNENNDCSNYIMLRNGLFPNSPFLGQGKYCTDLSENVNTTANFLYIKYNASLSAGFKLQFQEVGVNCGEEIRLTEFDTETIIYTPNYPNIAPPHTECSWIISAPPSRILRLDFIDRFDLTTSDGCYLERVEVRDGSTRFSPELGILCGQRPNSLFSTNNFMFIKFLTDIDEPSNGFKAKITMAECGGFITGSQGEIKLPIHSKSNYFGKSNCTWHLMGPAYHYINMTFTEIDLPPSDANGCVSVDHIEIKEKIPVNNEEKIIGLYCGNTNPGSILSSSNEITIKFINVGNSESVPKFRLVFESGRESCGETFNMDEGVFTSPGYPNLVQSDVYCEWTITVSNGRRITLEFLDLELSSNLQHEQGIAYSFGQDPRSDVAFLKKYESGQIIKSSENVLILYFWNYIPSNVRGFKVQFSSNEPTACASDFSKLSGVLTPPGENMTHYTCSWVHVINSDNGQTLSLSIQLNSNINKGNHFCATYDSVLDVIIGDSTPLAKFCAGYQSSVILSPYIVTKINVYKSESHNFNFTVDYETYPCGGIISDPIGSISSPNLLGPLNGKIDCAWIFKLPSDEAIMVNFTTFHFNSNCDDSHLTMYSGSSPMSPRIGKFCRDQLPKDFHIQNNELLIQYHQNDKSKILNNFTLSYETVSEGYPKNYPENLHCVYEIHAPGKVINIVFSDFNLEKSLDCKFDYISITARLRRGKSDLRAPKLYCGSNKPAPLRFQDFIAITFNSDSSSVDKGFKFSFSTDDCGGRITAPTIISSPRREGYVQKSSFDYLTTYSSCLWNITAPSNKHVIVEFKLFELMHSHGCNFEYLDVYDGFQLDANLKLSRLCGNLTDSPPVFKSTGNSLLLNLRTSFSGNNAGFQAYVYFQYGAEVGCGGNLFINETRVISPSNISAIMDCQWQIKTTEPSVIKIEFLELNLEGCFYHDSNINNTSCIPTYIQIHDGPSFVSETMDILNSSWHVLPTYLTTSNYLWIRFLGLNLPITGFRIRLRPISSPCGTSVLKVTNETGTLMSPKYPESYPNNIRCKWLLNTNDYFEKIKIEFIDFDLTYNQDKSFCKEDRIEISDKHSFNKVTDALGTTTLLRGKHAYPAFAAIWIPTDTHQFCGRNSSGFTYYSGSNEVIVSFYGS